MRCWARSWKPRKRPNRGALVSPGVTGMMLRSERGTADKAAARERAPRRRALRRSYTKPWSIIASATLRKPAMFAPFT